MQRNELRSKSGGAVMLTPDVGQGYLVLNKAENPNVHSWVIEVNTRIFDQNSQPLDKTLDKVVLKNNNNYWQVPEKMAESEKLLFLEITGLDNSGNPVVTEGPIIVTDHPETALESGSTGSFLPGCKWVCNGSYYAWEIQQYVNPVQPLIGNSYLTVQTALNFNEALQQATPNYRYITQSQYSALCPGGNGEIVGIPCGEPSGIWITEAIPIPQGSNDYRDLNGNVIPGPDYVRGVGKPLGDWGGGQPIMTPELTFGMNSCGNDTWWAMSKVNNYPPSGHPFDGTGNIYYPDLACDNPTSTGVTGSSPSSSSCIQGVIDDYLNTPTQSPDDNDTIGDVWTPFVNAIIDCLTATDQGDGSVLS